VLNPSKHILELQLILTEDYDSIMLKYPEGQNEQRRSPFIVAQTHGVELATWRGLLERLRASSLNGTGNMCLVQVAVIL
jgi:hypothetical protein